MGDPQNADATPEARSHERAATVEEILSTVRADLGRQDYPTTSEELAATYAADPSELPNETESIGSVFDRLDDRFEDAEAAYRALVTEFEGGLYADEGDAGKATGTTPAERATWDEARADDDRPPAGGAGDPSEYENDDGRNRRRAGNRTEESSGEGRSDDRRSEALTDERDDGR